MILDPAFCKWLSHQLTILEMRSLPWTTTIDLEPSTKQEFQELNDSAKAIEAQLNKVEEKKEMLEIENKKLKEYIEGLLNPLRREDPTFVPPIAIAQGSLNDHEAMRSTY